MSGKINDSFKRSYCYGEQSDERSKTILKGHAVKQRLLFRKYGKYHHAFLLIEVIN